MAKKAKKGEKGEEGQEVEEVQEVSFKPGWSLAPPGHRCHQKHFSKRRASSPLFYSGWLLSVVARLTRRSSIPGAKGLPGKSEAFRKFGKLFEFSSRHGVDIR